MRFMRELRWRGQRVQGQQTAAMPLILARKSPIGARSTPTSGTPAPAQRRALRMTQASTSVPLLGLQDLERVDRSASGREFRGLGLI
jgi:hypothetical protein